MSTQPRHAPDDNTTETITVTPSGARRRVTTPRAARRDAEGSFFRQRMPFLFSVRFGLTAWYAGVLILTIALVGVAFRVLLIHSLEQDAYERLSAAAEEVRSKSTEEREASLGNQDMYAPIVRAIPDVDVDSITLSGVSVTVYAGTDTSDPIIEGGILSDHWPTDEALQELLESREPSFETTRVSGHSIRSYSLPIFSENNHPVTGKPLLAGTIFTSESLAVTNRVLAQMNRVLLISGVFGAVVASAGGWVLAGRALAPVNRIMSSADDIARDRSARSLSRRLEVPPTGDEIAQLAETFNAMLDRIEQAFTAQRRFIADASHELRTPLTSIKGNIDVLRHQISSGHIPDPQDIDEALGDVARESSRMSRLVEDLLDLARNEAQGAATTTEPSPVSLDVLAREAARTAEGLLQGQELHLDVSQSVEIRGNGDQLVQVMLILLDNAIRHTPAGGHITLSVGTDLDPADGLGCARIDVEDTGCGIDPDHLPHLFERFYRAEGSRTRTSGGTGLGLAIALSIVRGHGGWIDVESAPGAGTHFTVWLPLPDKSQRHGDARSGTQRMSKVPSRRPISEHSQQQS